MGLVRNIIKSVIVLVLVFLGTIIFINEAFTFNGFLFLKSIGIILGATLLCIILGLMAALGLWTIFTEKIQSIAVIVLILFLIPAFVHVQSWIFFVDGIFVWINNLVGMSFNFNGIVAVILTMAFSCLPIPTGLTLFALKGVPNEVEEMLRLDGPDGSTFFKIYLPYLLPGLIVSAILVFLLNINDYGISSVFGVNTYALELFSQFSAGLSVDTVFYNGLPLIFISLSLLIVFGFYLSRTHFSLGEQGGKNPFKNLKLGKIFIVLGMIITLLFVFVPIGNLLYELSQSGDIIELIRGSLPEVFYSILISGLSALMAFIPALLIAIFFYKSPIIYGLLGILAIPFIIPGPILGLALIRLFNTPMLAFIYESPLMPMVALVSKYMFIEAIVLVVTLSSLDQNLIDSMRIHWPGKRRYIKCLIELMEKKYLGALLIVFALSMGEFGVSLLVTPPGYQMLSIKIYNYLHYGASDVVAALCLLMVFIILLVGVGLFKVLGGDDA